jgi:hypothetical protein
MVDREDVGSWLEGPPVGNGGAPSGSRLGLPATGSVRNDLIFHFLKLVLDCEFFLLHALHAQLVAADSYHRIDGCIEIRVFLFQTCDGQPDLGLFLIGHAEPHSVE